MFGFDGAQRVAGSQVFGQQAHIADKGFNGVDGEAFLLHVAFKGAEGGVEGGIAGNAETGGGIF